MITNAADLQTLFSNPIFLSAFFSLLIAQFIKAVISLVKARREALHEAMLIFFWRTGGMPSSHSAVAVSISTAVALTEGFSNLFIVSLFLSLIVIRDALGVRRSAGLQSKALNRLGNDLSLRIGVKYESVKEVHGHTWPEVMVGSALGLCIAFAFCRL
ncbi:MAG TPA: divergent PAP2 family protein [Rectinemataceae bacterium]|nr:divergent PAP2 family protein [Rectinemataceae bacterium]